MKKAMKKFVSAALCVCLSLSLFSIGGFADCGPGESGSEDSYSITPSTIPLTGEAVDFTVSANTEFMPSPNMAHSGVIVWPFVSYEDLHATLGEFDTALNEITAQYSPDFFKEKGLLVVTVSPGYSPFTVEIDSVVKNGRKIGINITAHTPQSTSEEGTSITAVLEVNKNDIAQMNNVSFFVERKIAWGGNDGQAPLRAGSAYVHSGFTAAAVSYVTGVAQGTTLEKYLENFTYDNMTVYGKDGKEIKDKSASVGTGLALVAKDENGVIIAAVRAVVRGDVDGDAKVTAADARLALRASVYLAFLTDTQLAAAKAGAQTLNAWDARQILRVSVGIDRF